MKRFPLRALSLALCAAVSLAVARAGGGGEAAPPAVLEGEGRILGLFGEAPPAVRAELFLRFQQRILTAPSGVDRDALSAAYQDLARKLRLASLTAETQSGEVGALIRRMEELHSLVRERLGRPSGRTIAAELEAGFERGDDPFRLLEETLRAVRALSTEGVGPGLLPDVRARLAARLARWCESWTAAAARGAFEKQLALLEDLTSALHLAPEEAARVESALLHYAGRLAAAAGDPRRPLSERMPLLEVLDGRIARLRSSRALPSEVKLDRTLRRRLCHTLRSLGREDLVFGPGWDTRQGGRPESLEVHSARLRAVHCLTPSAGGAPSVAGSLSVTAHEEDLRPFYLPPLTPLAFVYELDLGRAARAEGPIRAAVVLDNLTGKTPGAELKPVLPRVALPGHVFVYDELRTQGRAYWVLRKPWTVREVVLRLRAHIARSPLEADRRRETAKLKPLWSLSNLRELGPDPSVLLSSEGGFEDAVLERTFWFDALSSAELGKLLAELFDTAEGILHKAAGEELPGNETAKLLMEGGGLFGFDPAGAQSLLDAGLSPRPRRGAARTAVVVAVPLRAEEAGQ